MIVAESVLIQWLKEAKAKEELVYARATFLSPNSVTRRLYELSQSGHVQLIRKRRTHGNGDENFHYCARRTAKPLPGLKNGYRAVKGVRPIEAVKPQDRRFSSHAQLVREIEPQVRAMLAEGHERSPTRIARALGLYSHNPVAKVLERLAA